MRRVIKVGVVLTILAGASIVYAALTVPTDIQQPGTQPNEIGNLESVDKCDNCHGGYDQAVEPAFAWRGGMMANATRDPIFWATMAIAEQDFDGAGDLCLRCHSPAGWLGGRSTPTNGSGLGLGDADGVECDFCHKLTNPNGSEHAGVMNPPFVANNGAGEGYYGSGMSVVWGGTDKLGPYSDADARHQFLASSFHRSKDFCGTCHDVSNPVVGDLAPNQGTQDTADPVVFSGVPGAPVAGKAAFNNFPFLYGIVERTYSEYRAGALSSLPVSAYPTLPAAMRTGALQAAYESAMATTGGPNYADGTPRTFTCQTCHMRPVTGNGCNKKGAPLRTDLPLHDQTGGNYWIPDVIVFLDGLGRLRAGGGLTAGQVAALEAGKTRVYKQLSQAATMTVAGDTLRLYNLTAHKLISGYPEGRRMWLNIRWYDGSDTLLREDGAYGPVGTIVNPEDGLQYTVESIIDLADPNTRIYEAHYGMTREWAAALLTLVDGNGAPLYSPSLALGYDRITGAVTETLGDLAAADVTHPHSETFHFVLNNTVIKDNRIPPYQMDYDEARRRNALPVPDTQYGNPGAGGIYDSYDDVTLNPPAGAVYAYIDLLYQPTSWEYIQFLWQGNAGQDPFLGMEGLYLLDAWLKTGMAAPFVMTSTTWGTAPTPPTPQMTVSSLTLHAVSQQGAMLQEATTFSAGNKVGIQAIVQSESTDLLAGAQVFLEIIGPQGGVVAQVQGFTNTQGLALLDWKTSKMQTKGSYQVAVANVIKSGYEINLAGSVPPKSFVVQ